MHRTALRAVPEVADALSLAASSASSASSLLVDAISTPSTTAAAAAAAASDTAATAATSLAASIARFASAAMLTLAELTNETTAAVAAEETRVVGSLAEVIIPSSTSGSLASPSPAWDLLASLPVASVFDPPHPEPANALSLPTWAIHVSSVAEWVIAMNLFWKLGGVRGGVPQWRGMSWGMVSLFSFSTPPPSPLRFFLPSLPSSPSSRPLPLSQKPRLQFEPLKQVPLLGGALCACTFHFFYNSPTLAPLVALQAGLTVVGNGTMWFATWRVFDATRGRREAEDEVKAKDEKEQQQQQV